MKHTKFFLILALLFTLIGNPVTSSEFTVTLPTKMSPHLVYVSAIKPQETSFSKEYIAQLRDVLTFDLEVSGDVLPTSQSAQAEKILQSPDPFALSFWENREPIYIVNLKVKNKSIFATLFSLKTGQSYQIKQDHLCGALMSDRRIMHKIADTLFELITGYKGIATTRILYALQIPNLTEDETTWKSEIWEADYDGANQKKITSENSYCICPVFFPKSAGFAKDKFIYVNYKNGQPKIFITHFGKTQGDSWIPLRGNQLLPTVSSKGDKIAFICDASGRADLFVQSIDQKTGLQGKPIRAYSFPNSVQASPTFSPDSTKIAFVSDKNGTPHIHLINTPTPGMEKMPIPISLTKKYKENSCPSWSPDGKKLAYSAKIGGIRQIMIYDFTAKEEIQLTFSNYHKENPSWAHNSQHLIYNSVSSSSSELFVIHLQQRVEKKMTQGPGKKHYPVWGH